MDVKLLHVEFGRAKFIKRAIRYSVIVKFRTEDNSVKKQEVWKRFEDFVYLKYELFKHIESAAETLPSFPDVPFWKFSDSTKVVKQRSSEITKLIDKIWNSPCLQESLPFKLFCQGLYTDTLGAKRRCTICSSSKYKIKNTPTHNPSLTFEEIHTSDFNQYQLDWEIVRDILPFAGGAYTGVQLDRSVNSAEDFTPDVIPDDVLTDILESSSRVRRSDSLPSITGSYQLSDHSFQTARHRLYTDQTVSSYQSVIDQQ